MQRTTSERVFEEFCHASGIDCRRIPETDTRTPDYELFLNDVRVVVEVKEMAPNDAERESDRVVKERGYGVASSETPCARVRKKIADSSGQIKARTEGTHPSILVLFDKGRIARHLDPYQIQVAMYGLEQIYLAVPPIGEGSPYKVGAGHGPKRKMTDQHNTSISAVGALVMTAPAQTELHVYHNRFAHIPLDPALLGRPGVAQFQIAESTTGRASEWRELPIDQEP